MNKVYKNLKNAKKADNSGTDYKLVGKYLTNFALSFVNFKAPNVNTGLKPK